MATLQKKYGSIQAWADVVEPKPKKNGERIEPDLDALIFFFTEAFNEGIEVENEEKNINRQLLTSRQVGRLVTKLGLEEANKKLKEAVINAQPEKVEEKNVNPTQDQVNQ
ncbi:hypothetical protein, partial [Ruminococcus sp.]|uniref:hypothetical protein n=1 Tax=Ruminococcus sp. TaxID=41978 RepID=UPI002E81A9A2